MRFVRSLPYRSPLDWPALLDFLAVRAIAGVERVSAGRYERTISFGAVAGRISVERAADGASLRLEGELSADVDPAPVVERVRRIFDLGADPSTIAEVLGRDARLAAVAKRHPGLRVPGCWDGFELAVRAVLGQQVTIRGAATLGTRLVDAYGTRLEDGGRTAKLFPDASVLRDASLEEIGLPRRRAATIRALSEAVATGGLELDPDPDRSSDVVCTLTALPGIGDWTAQYVAMRALRAGDAFPASDLVLRKAVAEDDRLPRAAELRARAEVWRPWRAYAAIHLWKSAGAQS